MSTNLELVKIPEREVPRLVCQHCKYSWLYKGTNPYRATCPRCRYAVKVEKSVRKSKPAGGSK